MKIIYTLLLALCPLLTFATRQQMDLLKFDGSDYRISTFPLELSPIRKSEPLPSPMPKGYKPATRFRITTNSSVSVVSSGNIRGYVATWKIEGGKLYLVRVDGWIEYNHSSSVPNPTPENPNQYTSKVTYTYKKATLDLLFPNDVKDRRVHATWFTGALITGGWYPGIKHSPEKRQPKLVFQIENGVIKFVIDRRTPNQSLQPTVKTPVKSGNEQGTDAGHP